MGSHFTRLHHRGPWSLSWPMEMANVRLEQSLTALAPHTRSAAPYARVTSSAPPTSSRAHHLVNGLYYTFWPLHARPAGQEVVAVG
jgi:hypothetical protein